jgi:hypothetical protein
VWEIWTKIDNTPHTRFWLEDKNGPEGYFAYFGDLAAYLDEKKSSIDGPADLTISQLIGALKPSQLWGVLLAVALLSQRSFCNRQVV